MAKWIIDPAHSEIGFKVKHLVISTVSGKFNQFEGELVADKDDFSDAKITFSADVNSIHTGSEQRDGHLKTSDFFDVENHAKITFESSSFVKKSYEEYELTGNLTIKGVSHPVTLKAEFGGIGTDFQGQSVAGFELSGKINRKDFGLSWNGVTEAGGVVVSDEVRLIINAELVKQA